MKKKETAVFIPIGIIIVLVILFLCMVGGFGIYRYYHPLVEINVSVESKLDENFNPIDDYSFERVVITFSEKTPLGMPKDTKEKINDMCTVLADFENDVHRNYDSPLDIKCQVEVKDGKTYITYSGTAARRDNNETEELYEEYVFHYVLTKKIKRNN